MPMLTGTIPIPEECNACVALYGSEFSDAHAAITSDGLLTYKIILSEIC